MPIRTGCVDVFNSKGITGISKFFIEILGIITDDSNWGWSKCTNFLHGTNDSGDIHIWYRQTNSMARVRINVRENMTVSGSIICGCWEGHYVNI